MSASLPFWAGPPPPSDTHQDAITPLHGQRERRVTVGIDATLSTETVRIKSKVKDLPIAAEALGEMIRGQELGGMTSAYMEYPAGLDLRPMLEGLERDHC